MKNKQEQQRERARTRIKHWRETHRTEARAYQRKWILEHPDRIREHSRRSRIKHRAQIKQYQRRWAEKNKEKLRLQRQQYYRANRTHILHRVREHAFGLPTGSYQHILTICGNNCQVCGKLRSKKGLALDHDHTTKHIRGLLCCECNSGIGLLQDNPDLLEKAARYLRDNRATDLREHVKQQENAAPATSQSILDI